MKAARVVTMGAVAHESFPTGPELPRLRDILARSRAMGAAPNDAALFALGWLGMAANQARRGDLLNVALSQYDPAHQRAPDLRAAQELLGAFLIELGTTLPGELEELARFVLELLGAAVAAP